MSSRTSNECFSARNPRLNEVMALSSAPVQWDRGNEAQGWFVCVCVRPLRTGVFSECQSACGLVRNDAQAPLGETLFFVTFQRHFVLARQMTWNRGWRGRKIRKVRGERTG